MTHLHTLQFSAALICSETVYVCHVACLTETSAWAYQSQDKRKWSALHAAAKYNQRDIAEMLMHEGADVTVRSDRDATPMHVACMEGNTHMMNIFLKAHKGREKAVRTHAQL